MTKPDANKDGAIAHIQSAQTRDGLPGSMPRPINVTFVGAGSMFCPILARDILLIPGAERGQIRLIDIDANRLHTVHTIIEKLLEPTGRSGGWTVTSSTERKDLLPGSDYVICSVEVAGLQCVDLDNDIPLKYGIDQCIGDTIGPGGLFKGLRTIPIFLDILRDMTQLCPDALMLNYTNPMNMMCLAAGRAVPQIKTVGLCHSVQGTSKQLADRVGIDIQEIDWQCAGINHLAWFTRFEHRGQDLYPRLMKQAYAEIYGNPEDSDNAKPDDIGEDLVRKDMMLHFGAFITESSGHLSEYLPYYRKSEAGKRYWRPGYGGESRFYASNWPRWRADSEKVRAKMVRGEEQFDMNRSWEHAAWIIEAREKNAPIIFHGNVMNTDPNHANPGPLIENLPHDGCVEVACRVDADGFHPLPFGKLPPQMAHICASNMAMFDLAATAAIEKSKQAAIHALMLDPLTAAVLTPAEIKQMTLEMFDAEKDFLPDFQ
ncbi:MAG: alpha-glucosidase/alpha-galactosidase [Phycisphaeraceae bacterium]